MNTTTPAPVQEETPFETLMALINVKPGLLKIANKYKRHGMTDNEVAISVFTEMSNPHYLAPEPYKRIPKDSIFVEQPKEDLLDQDAIMLADFLIEFINEDQVLLGIAKKYIDQALPNTELAKAVLLEYAEQIS